MVEFKIPAEYHMALPRMCEIADCDHESRFSCSDERYVVDEIVTWLTERTKSYYVSIPFEKGVVKSPKPFVIFIADPAIAVQFKLMFSFPCIEH